MFSYNKMIPPQIPVARLGQARPSIIGRNQIGLTEMPNINNPNWQTKQRVYIPTLIQSAVMTPQDHAEIPCRPVRPPCAGYVMQPLGGNLYQSYQTASGNQRGSKKGMASSIYHKTNSKLIPQHDTFYPFLNSTL
jgi:hypothetical protein